MVALKIFQWKFYLQRPINSTNSHSQQQPKKKNNSSQGFYDFLLLPFSLSTNLVLFPSKWKISLPCIPFELYASFF